VEDHVEHARAMARAIGRAPTSFLDLGTGAGIPGLVLAWEWPTAHATLLDSRQRPAAFLGETIEELALADRIQIATARAEDAARDPAHRAAYDLVVARSFAPPAVTAECARGFLSAGGRLAVSDPPDADPTTRWPQEGLTKLGFKGPEIRTSGEATIAILTATGPPPATYPRPTGRPAKNPLW
jgi:16S rRNA (guanine527-N7)-methyltransferase